MKKKWRAKISQKFKLVFKIKYKDIDYKILSTFLYVKISHYFILQKSDFEWHLPRWCAVFYFTLPVSYWLFVVILNKLRKNIYFFLFKYFVLSPSPEVPWNGLRPL